MRRQDLSELGKLVQLFFLITRPVGRPLPEGSDNHEEEREKEKTFIYFVLR